MYPGGSTGCGTGTAYVPYIACIGARGGGGGCGTIPGCVVPPVSLFLPKGFLEYCTRIGPRSEESRMRPCWVSWADAAVATSANSMKAEMPRGLITTFNC